MIEANHFEEVTQIKLSREVDGRPLYWVAAYLVDSLLIDTGCAHTAQELVAFLESSPLNLVVNTHYHEDHVGGNHLLQQTRGVEILAPQDSVPLIAHRPELFPYQEIAWGYPSPSEARPLPSHIKTDHLHFDVIETPGHCQGHVALVEPTKGWCFSADLFVSETPKVVRPEEDVHGLIASMRKIAALETKSLVLFTSIGKIVEDGRSALRSCASYLEELSRRAKDLEQKGLSVDQIRDELLGGESSLAPLSDGQFSSANLIRAVLQA